MNPISFLSSDITACKIGIIGICFDQNSSYRAGAAAAPALIREAFFCESANLWNETGKDLGEPNLFFDAGDLTPTREDFVKSIGAAISRLCAQRLRPLVLGGDHSITYPITKALAQNSPPFSILHIDAHPDIY